MLYQYVAPKNTSAMNTVQWLQAMNSALLYNLDTCNE